MLAQLDALKSADVGTVIAELIRAGMQALIEAEATEKIGAGRYERSEDRGTHRNGHRAKLVSTTSGDIELKIPKLRAGSFFPALLERRRRIDKALHAVIMEAYVHGVSTRSVDDLVGALGVDSGISKSEVSRICAGLDREVEAFRTRTLNHTAFPYVFADATFRCPRRTQSRCDPAVLRIVLATLPRPFHAQPARRGLGQARPGGDRGGQDGLRSHRTGGGRSPVGHRRGLPGRQYNLGGARGFRGRVDPCEDYFDGPSGLLPAQGRSEEGQAPGHAPSTSGLTVAEAA
jgi:hypothetical protein